MKPKIKLNLNGPGGNAIVILGICQSAAKKAGWTKEQIDAFMSEAMSGDYENLLAVVRKHFDDK